MKKKFIVYSVLIIILLAISSIYDYEISEFLYNRTNLLCTSIHIIAQTPTLFLLALLSVGIYNTRNRDASLASMFSAILGALSAIVFGFIGVYTVLYNLGYYSITFTIAIDLGIYICSYILTKIISDRHADELRKLSKLGLLSFISLVVVLFISTACFERIIFRRLDGVVNVFSNWYDFNFDLALNGFTNRSFPSFTVGYASISLIVYFFSRFLTIFKERRIILSILIYAWIFVVTISEIVLGYAYLSDAMMSLLIGNFVIGVNYLIIYSEKKVKISESEE